MGNIIKHKHQQPNHINTLREEPLGTDVSSGPKVNIPHSLTLIRTEQLNNHIVLIRVQSKNHSKKLRSNENHNPARDRVSYIDLKPKYYDHLSSADMCGQRDSNGTSQHIQYEYNMITKHPHSQYWFTTWNHGTDQQCSGLQSGTSKTKYDTREEWGSSRRKDSGFRGGGCNSYTASNPPRRLESRHHCTLPLIA